MKRAITPLRIGVASMLDLVASQRPDLLTVFLDIIADGPARSAVLRLASDLGVRESHALPPVLLKISADLDRLEKRRTGWSHPRKIVADPNVGGLLYFCRARIHNVSMISRRRRLEIMAKKLERIYDQEKTRAWIADFIGTTGDPSSGEG